MYSSTGRDRVSCDDQGRIRELIWMDWPIIPEYCNGTASIKRPALDQGAIGHTTTSRFRRVYLVPFCILALDLDGLVYVPSMALLVAL
jgi:hypothetical protein